MQTTIDFLNACKAARGFTSDYQLSKFLGVTPQSVSLLIRGRTFMSDETALKVADCLGIYPALVLANIHAERAKGEVEKRVWKDLVKRLGGTAAALLLVVCVFSEKPVYADGVTIDRENVYYVKSHKNYAHSLKFALFRWLRRFNDFIAFFGLSLRPARCSIP